MTSILGFGLIDAETLIQIWMRSRNQFIINGVSKAIMPMISQRLNSIGLIGKFL